MATRIQISKDKATEYYGDILKYEMLSKQIESVSGGPQEILKTRRSNVANKIANSNTMSRAVELVAERSKDAALLSSKLHKLAEPDLSDAVKRELDESIKEDLKKFLSKYGKKKNVEKFYNRDGSAKPVEFNNLDKIQKAIDDLTGAPISPLNKLRKNISTNPDNVARLVAEFNTNYPGVLSKNLTEVRHRASVTAEDISHEIKRVSNPATGLTDASTIATRLESGDIAALKLLASEIPADRIKTSKLIERHYVTEPKYYDDAKQTLLQWQNSKISEVECFDRKNKAEQQLEACGDNTDAKKSDYVSKGGLFRYFKRTKANNRILRSIQKLLFDSPEVRTAYSEYKKAVDDKKNAKAMLCYSCCTTAALRCGLSVRAILIGWYRYFASW